MYNLAQLPATPGRPVHQSILEIALTTDRDVHTTGTQVNGLAQISAREPVKISNLKIRISCIETTETTGARSAKTFDDWIHSDIFEQQPNQFLQILSPDSAPIVIPWNFLLYNNFPSSHNIQHLTPSGPKTAKIEYTLILTGFLHRQSQSPSGHYSECEQLRIIEKKQINVEQKISSQQIISRLIYAKDNRTPNLPTTEIRNFSLGGLWAILCCRKSIIGASLTLDQEVYNLRDKFGSIKIGVSVDLSEARGKEVYFVKGQLVRKCIFGDVIWDCDSDSCDSLNLKRVKEFEGRGEYYEEVLGEAVCDVGVQVQGGGGGGGGGRGGVGREGDGRGRVESEYLMELDLRSVVLSQEDVNNL